MINGITVEICAGSLTDCLAADAVAETDRIELNCSLELGGITPSLNTLLMAKERVHNRIICMVRPRPAGFIYNADELESMYRDAKTFLDNGADGIVFGVLNQNHEVDEAYTAKMCQLIHSYGKEAVFHKAYDNAADPDAAMQALIRCGVDRVLTSGQKPSAETGAPLIAELIRRYGDQIEILPGGGVTAKNAAKILKNTGASQIHMTAKTSLNDDGIYFAVSEENIRNVLDTLRPARSMKKAMTGEDIAMLKSDAYEESMYHFEEDEH